MEKESLRAEGSPLCGQEEKKQVRDFYEQVGWQRGKEGTFVDALAFEDLRQVSRDYIHNCHLRVKRHLRGGRYLLDVASGPIQYPEYLSYSEDYDIRICIDISFSALREARKKLGERGIYIIGDITSLPLKDSAVDGAVSLHTVYHVPAREQADALREIHRVLKPGSQAVVVYSWGNHSLLMTMILFPFLAGAAILRRTKRYIAKQKRRQNADWQSSSSAAGNQKLYFHAHPYRWFAGKTEGLACKVLVWRSLSVPFLKVYIHRWLLGRQILALIYRLEERFPSLLGRIGQYPMIIMNKR